MAREIRSQMRFPNVSGSSKGIGTLQLDPRQVLRHHGECKICCQRRFQEGVRFMKIEMTHIRTEITRVTQPNLWLPSD